MWSNTKALIIISLLFIFFGLGFLWYGWEAVPEQPVQSPISSEPATLSLEGEQAYVFEVVDGDTIKVVIDGKEFTVRYLGVDTPETKHPSKPVECFGKEAFNENKDLVGGKWVILQKDVSDTDKYNRLLRYIYLPLEDNTMLFVNDYLIREGYATALNYPPDNKYNQQFLEAQESAKMESKGMWGRC